MINNPYSYVWDDLNCTSYLCVKSVLEGGNEDIFIPEEIRECVQ